MRHPIGLAALMLGALLGAPLHAQARCAPVDPYDSGGPLDPDEAVYDVRFYDLGITVDPADSTIRGRVDLHAQVVAPAWRVAFDLGTISKKSMHCNDALHHFMILYKKLIPSVNYFGCVL